MKMLIIAIILLVSCGEEPVNQNEVTLVFRGLAGLTGGKTEGIGADWDKIQEIVAREMPGTTLKLTPIFAPEGEYFTKLAIALRNDSSYDIISEDSFILQSDVAAGLLAPLDIKDWDDWTNFYESSREAATVDGLVYTIPWNTDARGIIYSKKLFKLVGLPENWQPKDWAEIIETAKKIKSLGSEVDGEEILPMMMYLGAIMGEATTMQSFLMILYGTQDRLFEDGKWVVDSKGLYDTLVFLKSLRDNDLVADNQYLLTAGHGAYALPIVVEGNVGLRFDGNWTAGSFLSAGMTNWRDLYAMAGMPTQFGDPNRPLVTFQGGFGFSISANSKRKEKALEVIKLITSYESLREIYPISGHISTRMDVAKDPEYQKIGLNKEGSEYSKYGFYRPANSEYPAVSVEIQVMVESIMTGTSIENAIETFGKNVEAMVGTEKIIRKPYTI